MTSAIAYASVIYIEARKVQIIDNCIEVLQCQCRRCKLLRSKLVQDREYLTTNISYYHTELMQSPITQCGVTLSDLQCIVDAEKTANERIVATYLSRKRAQLQRLHQQ